MKDRRQELVRLECQHEQCIRMVLCIALASILILHCRVPSVTAFDVPCPHTIRRIHFSHQLIHQSKDGIIDENEETDKAHDICISRRKPKKLRRIQFVPWAGKSGMLPHQYFYGELNHDEYKDWLQMPLDISIQLLTTSSQDYFSSVPKDSFEDITAESIHKPNLPQIQAMHLKPIYIDEHIIVVNKPSGVMSVPGPRRHECVASLVYRYFGKNESHYIKSLDPPNKDGRLSPLTDADNKNLDTMVVHRLDRDTSGVLLFARNDNALKQLHSDFKDKTRKRVVKKYIALVCGHWHSNTMESNDITINEGEIDLPLMRDLDHPPFMRIATASAKLKQDQLKQQSLDNNESQRHNHPGYLRMVGKEAKPSLTTYRILSYEYLRDSSARRLPVTRVELVPVTGRTHQLRVHCAAVGHPIVGDSIYGYSGEGTARGGLEYNAIDEASLDVQRDIHNYWLKTHRDKRNDVEIKVDNADEECMLCLHAYQLAVFHPLTEAPMMFECNPPF